MPKELKEKAENLLKLIKENGSAVVDTEIKSLGKVTLTPKECAFLCRQVGMVYHEGLEDRVVQFRFTDATLDRDGDVIIPSGVDLSKYKKEPIVLAQHESRNFPIGRSLKTKFRKPIRNTYFTVS